MSTMEQAAPRDLYITAELHRRVPKVTDHLAEKLALQDIGAQMLDHPDQVLPKLVERAMQVTGAASAGISAFESQPDSPGIFRWCHLHGELASFEGATTPRDYSPAAFASTGSEPTLTRHPERHYSWIADAGVVCPEVLLVPLYLAHGQPLGTVWIVSAKEGYFDSGHARFMRELASFVGIALAMLHNQRQLKEALAQQEMLTREMDHRVNNAFFVIDSMIQVGKRTATSAADFADTVSGRLHALSAAHAIVRHSIGTGLNVLQPAAATLRGLTAAIFKPYETAGERRFAVAGEDINLGDGSITSLALVFHELATNAVKYGALSTAEGQVSLGWQQQDGTLTVRWQEAGGPPVKAPPGRYGFGSNLLRNTVTRRFGGTLQSDWIESGLIVEFTLPLVKLST